jgi:pimeloyl-ACP methyl ester carboxylesterase
VPWPRLPRAKSGLPGVRSDAAERMKKSPVEHRYAAPAGEICWFEWGAAGAKPTLLLLHATGFHARCWDATVAALPDDQHVVALDLRGHGRSYRPDSLSDWMETADDVVAFLRDQIAAPVVAVGHSMGAYVAAWAAAMAPEKFAQLLLVDPVMMVPEIYAQQPDGAGSSPNDHPVARRRNAWDSAEQMIERFASREPYMNWRADVLANYCTYGLVPAASGEGLELACPPLLEASAYMGAWRNNPYLWIEQVDCRTTILRARNAERKSAMDFSASPTAPDLWKSFADARDLQWPDVSHFIPMEAPERLAELIAQTLRPDS